MRRGHRAGSITPEYLSDAPIVAIVHTTGQQRVHWNNATNSEWQSEDMSRPPMIYRDQEVEVLRVLKGSLGPVEWIRSVGGTVGDRTFEMEGGSELTHQTTYLLFLRWEDTPTQEGSERFLGVYGQAGGVFSNRIPTAHG